MKIQMRFIKSLKLSWEPLIALVAVFSIWHLAASAIGNRVLMPPPLLVITSLVDIFSTEILPDIGASLWHLAVGFGLGASTGFLLSIAATSCRVVEQLLDPLIELLRPISGIAWIPIAIMIFGIGDGVPVFLIFYVSIFPIFLNTVAGIKAVPVSLKNAASVLGASRTMMLSRVILPAAAPLILSGVRLSLGVSWMTLIAAELIGADSGLGWRAFWYEQFFSMHKIMAVILIIGVLGYLIDSVVRAFQAYLLSWSPDGAGEAS